MMYRLQRTTTPAQVLTRAECKLHLRVDHALEDNMIDGLAKTVQAMLEPPDGWLGRALASATYVLSLTGFDDIIKLPAPPFVSLTTFKYYDTDGDEQTVDSDVYRVVEKDIAYIERVSGESWPALETRREYPITVTYVAGYATGTVPEPITAFMKMQLSALYDQRSLIGAQQLHMTPFVLSMLDGWRVHL